MNKLRIFLDMDGVLANFQKAACSHFAIEYPRHKKRLYPKWLEQEGKISKNEIDDLMYDYQFWYTIEMYSYTKELIELCNELADEVYILSKPMDHENCYIAKIDWCLEKLKLNRKQLIITEAPKHLLAHDYTDILIDDKPKMIERWYAAGGEGYWWQELVENEFTSDIVKDRFKKLKELIAKLRGFQSKER